MKAQSWIFTVRYWEEGRSLDIDRWAVVGPGRASTVEAALHLASLPEEVRAQIRANSTVREFVDGLLDSDKTGYYVHEVAHKPHRSWVVCIGPIHAVLGD